MALESVWHTRPGELGARLRAFLASRAPTGVDADDLTQEVLLRIQQHVGEVRDAEKIEAWVFQVARNVVTDALRARRRREALGAQLVPEPPDDEDAAAYRDAEAKLSSCMGTLVDRLPEPYRSAIHLTEIAGLTHAEAARTAGVSVSGMKSRVQRGRAMLRRSFEDCCTIALDARGHITEFTPRPDGRLPDNCCE